MDEWRSREFRRPAEDCGGSDSKSGGAPSTCDSDTVLASRRWALWRRKNAEGDSSCSPPARGSAAGSIQKSSASPVSGEYRREESREGWRVGRKTHDCRVASSLNEKGKPLLKCGTQAEEEARRSWRIRAPRERGCTGMDSLWWPRKEGGGEAGGVGTGDDADDSDDD